MPDSTRQTTTLNRRWLVKMYVFLTALVVIGAWGALDAFVVYPKRGLEFAEFMLKDYLDAARSHHGVLTAINASVEDPAADMRELSEGLGPQNTKDRAKLAWLTALSRVYSLDALTRQNRAELQRRNQAGYAPQDTVTLFEDPQGLLDRLGTALKTRQRPKPLSALDIPSQYIIMACGLAGALWMVVFLVRCAARKFHFQPDTCALTLPDGTVITPDLITDIDKRKWDKFFVTLTLKDGRHVKLDLLRYSPLEEWFLEMEKRSPCYQPPEKQELDKKDEGAETSPPSDTPAGSETPPAAKD